MDETALASAKTGAIQGIYGMSEGDEISVVTFDDVAAIPFPLASITGDGTRAAAAAVNGITRGEGTSIGAGLEAAYYQLVSSTAESRDYVLLSDGEENVAPYVSDVIGLFEGLDGAAGRGPGPDARGGVRHRIHSIAFGDEADGHALATAAASTCGLFLTSPDRNDPVALGWVYDAVRSATTGVQLQGGTTGTLAALGVATVPFVVTPDVAIQTFKLLWADPAAEFELELTGPGGTPVAVGGGVSVASGPGVQTVTVADPETGTWSVSVRAISTTAPTGYAIAFSARSSLRLAADVAPGPYQAGTSVPLVATLTNGGQPLVGAAVYATVVPPSAEATANATRIAALRAGEGAPAGRDREGAAGGAEATGALRRESGAPPRSPPSRRRSSSSTTGRTGTAQQATARTPPHTRSGLWWAPTPSPSAPPGPWEEPPTCARRPARSS